MPDQLTVDELREIASDPQKAFENPTLRGKALGCSTADLRSQLRKYAESNNLDPSSMIKEIIKVIDPT